MLEGYFAAKKRLYPQSVKGRFRKLKWILNTIFLSIYLLTPFIRFDRGENTPNQAVLIDLPNSKAYFFFLEIWPQEVFYLAGILVIAAVVLFFVTSLFGRIWCGYACFQTVWTDIFIAVERLFQGDRNTRIILDRKETFEKFWRKAATHLIWIIISLITGYSFVMYFNDALTLPQNLNLNIWGWILGVSSMTYLMAGFAREHVCTYMCPYSRFQSAMFDNNTLIISYDQKRGEPRGKWDGDINKSSGHCIDCKQCVVVCPTGIDIRNGLQMECIACGLCVDACDNVMEKIGLPKGLIRYDTMAHLLDPRPEKKFKILRPRSFYYATILALACGLMLHGLLSKPTLEISAIPDRSPVFVRLSDDSIRNGYTLKISNKTHEKKIFTLRICSKSLPADSKVQGSASLPLLTVCLDTPPSLASGSPQQDFEQILKINQPQQAILKAPEQIEVKANEVGTSKIFVILPQEIIAQNEEGRGWIEFVIRGDKEEKNVKAVFISR
ncbi:MAG: cytochrome c oxidase accessory protein CcoG [Alphaproteobacteria bacterium]|nr:cytochrome c oxidase accessory protein CcoG [Alphaproteobacteria bacterium]